LTPGGDDLFLASHHEFVDFGRDGIRVLAQDGPCEVAGVTACRVFRMPSGASSVSRRKDDIPRRSGQFPRAYGLISTINSMTGAPFFVPVPA